MDNSEALIREAARVGEEFLRSQMQMALAADQRAISLGGILAAAASIILGFLFSDDGSMSKNAYIVSVLMSGGLGLASCLAFYSARPVSMDVVGNDPSSWDKDIEADKPYVDALKEVMDYTSRAIKANTIVIDGNARFLKWSMIVASVTVIASSIAGVFILAASTPINAQL